MLPFVDIVKRMVTDTYDGFKIGRLYSIRNDSINLIEEFLGMNADGEYMFGDYCFTHDELFKCDIGEIFE